MKGDSEEGKREIEGNKKKGRKRKNSKGIGGIGKLGLRMGRRERKRDDA